MNDFRASEASLNINELSALLEQFANLEELNLSRTQIRLPLSSGCRLAGVLLRLLFIQQQQFYYFILI
jgi:hypothetical protein